MDCKRGNPVLALGVGGNILWKKTNCSPHLEVAFRPCVSGDVHKNKMKIRQSTLLTNFKTLLQSHLFFKPTVLVPYKFNDGLFWVIWTLSKFANLRPWMAFLSETFIKAVYNYYNSFDKFVLNFFFRKRWAKWRRRWRKTRSRLSLRKVRRWNS